MPLYYNNINKITDTATATATATATDKGEGLNTVYNNTIVEELKQQLNSLNLKFDILSNKINGDSSSVSKRIDYNADSSITNESSLLEFLLPKDSIKLLQRLLLLVYILVIVFLFFMNINKIKNLYK